MVRLEAVTPGTVLHGIVPMGAVTVVAVQWYGSTAVDLTYKDAEGRPGTRLLYREDEPTLALVNAGRAWSFDGDGRLFRLVAEAHRIRLAHLFDPVLAVHTSLVEPLPHQITVEGRLAFRPIRMPETDQMARLCTNRCHTPGQRQSGANGVVLVALSCVSRKRTSMYRAEIATVTCTVS
ncbi:hypothetical protein [Candidatus Chloroploca asiatica]|uniref:Uncharacterized protein n=1 Tax=Candidatus Chloroploca asiatica TaxID=1506545 RepID=A0A2H3L686_9CHLR|nr:hypothetical protein [Candidatus Chloroploca asiatica]PDV97769.1 hypothetical protein A9Q02_17655 [Candidatus Chloroploca asiatica]